MRVLGIETSCDETSVAVVEDGVTELTCVIASSKEFHEKTGGVVPEIAARKQVEFIVPVLDQVFSQVPKETIDAIAVTKGPGLIGSLIVGIESAKALSLALGKPIIAVNHLVAHFYANFLTYPAEDIIFPALALVVSGGHTDLVLVQHHGNLKHLGSTVDDAAGEAFDKTARILGIGDYLGGAKLSQKALECRKNTLAGKLPRPMLDQSNYDFSFSGLKTAVKRLVENQNKEENLSKNEMAIISPSVEEIALEFETAVVDVLVGKTIRASQDFGVKSILLGGGVAANTALRTRLEIETKRIGKKFFKPDSRLCGDNASAVASAGFFNQNFATLEELRPNPSMSIMD